MVRVLASGQHRQVQTQQFFDVIETPVYQPLLQAFFRFCIFRNVAADLLTLQAIASYRKSPTLQKAQFIYHHLLRAGWVNVSGQHLRAIQAALAIAAQPAGTAIRAMGGRRNALHTLAPVSPRLFDAMQASISADVLLTYQDFTSGWDLTRFLTEGEHARERAAAARQMMQALRNAGLEPHPTLWRACLHA